MIRLRCIALALAACSPFAAEPADGGGGTPPEPVAPSALGDGRDGPLKVGSGERMVNAYFPAAAAAAGADRVELEGEPSGLAAGDLVLLVQPTGLASRPASGEPGELTLGQDDGAGAYALGRVRAIEGRAVVLEAPLPRRFDAPFEIVRVPQHTDVRVASGARVVARAWDGKTGGVVALLANGSLDVDGEISADGRGLRGGVAAKITTPNGCTALDGALSDGYAEKGEGLAGEPKGNGPGSVATGGGGGACHNAGGGGGGHAGEGGRGGKSWSGDGSREAPSGRGGSSVTSAPDRLLMGGGGGAGENNDGARAGGGAGGGIVFVRAARVRGAGALTASGEDGSAGDTSGSGGGGAGGTVDVRATEALACGRAGARGGAGGDHRSDFTGGGPGGGGGGGVVRLAAPALDACPASVDGGRGGVAVQRGDDPYGTSPGAPGRVER